MGWVEKDLTLSERPLLARKQRMFEGQGII